VLTPGIADVEQITPQELATRKGRLVLTACDPTVLDKGFTVSKHWMIRRMNGEGEHTHWIVVTNE
jgi:hypothetical protein